VNTVLRRALDHHGYTLRALDVSISTQLDPSLPLVSGDALQLQQVVSNVIANAEQALSDHRGQRQLQVSSTRQGDLVCISVQDSGPGIMPHHLDRVMEPMFTTRGAHGHRGLGLTITHTIVRDHAGSIEVYSVPGEGARFSVLLPALPVGPATDRAVDGDGIAAEGAGPVISMTPAGAPVAHAPAAHAPAHGETAAVSTGASILLIEDEVTLRTAISRFLRTSGYRVVSAESGSAALDVIATQRFDLILLDLRMTGVTGEDVYESMQNSHPDQAAKVVFMTGDLHSTHAARFIRQTGRPVLAKPFTLSELAARVAQLVSA
jgi:two-component system NtrC family sensor kinase